MNEYEQKQQDRRERILARADRLRSEGQSRYKSGMDRLKAIPFGQPILIGHHSEKRDRNYRRKACGAVERGCEMLRLAEKVEARADAVGTGGVSSDDPDAIVKLTAELNEKKAYQEAMKARNKAWQKAGNKAGRQPNGEWVEPPCAPWQLSNNSANIRRIEARIKALEAAAGRETRSQEFEGGIALVENAEANRVQLKFPGKPSEAVRTKLKKAGFRWSPMAGAWQRQLNNRGVWQARELVKEICELGLT